MVGERLNGEENATMVAGLAESEAMRIAKALGDPIRCGLTAKLLLTRRFVSAI